MMKQPKVLVACPTYKGKDYCVHEWIAHIKDLKYSNYDIFIVDNTNDKGKHAKWMRDTFGIEVVHHFNKKAHLAQMMSECNEIIRKKVIDEGYDYLMSIESDVFPPKNIIPKLMNHNRLIVSGMYQIGFREHKFPILQIVEPQGLNPDGTPHLNIRQMWWSEMLQFIDGTVKPIHGCGIGCTLMRKELLEKFKFRYEKDIPTHADSWLYLDLQNAGVQAYVDTSILCKHLNTDWLKVYEERKKDMDVSFNLKIERERK